MVVAWQAIGVILLVPGKFHAVQQVHQVVSWGVCKQHNISHFVLEEIECSSLVPVR